MNPSSITETDYQVGQLVELQAELCRLPCEDDCGCREQVAHNGHQGVVLNAYPTAAGDGYYRVDGLAWLAYGDELRAVAAPPMQHTPFERPATDSERALLESLADEVQS